MAPLYIDNLLRGMEEVELKRKFGSDMCFHGGVENQRILPFGTPEEVRTEVRHCIDALAGDRTGYILAPCHNLESLTPEEAETAESKFRTLIVPEGFTREAIDGTQQELRLEKEPGSNEEFGLAAEVHIIRAIVRLVSRLAEIGDPGDPSDAEEAATARAEYDRLGARPALVGLEVSTAGKGRPVPTGRAQSVPGMLVFTVMMMMHHATKVTPL